MGWIKDLKRIDLTVVPLSNWKRDMWFKKKDRITETVLKLVSLGGQADSYARSLSGGMKRRLLMAKALVHQPPIIILDEPTAGVDVD